MGTDPDFEHSIPNAWMAASPGHPFFLVLAEMVMKRFRQMQNKEDIGTTPESITGPIVLRMAIQEYQKNDPVPEHTGEIEFRGKQSHGHEVILLPSHVVYPYSWGPGGESVRDICWVLSDGYDADKCKNQLEVGANGSIAITYWSHTHSPDGHNEENMKHIE
jgi:hypothetical protein